MIRSRMSAVALALFGILWVAMPVAGQTASAPATQLVQVPLDQQIQAELRSWQTIFQSGQPIWIEFVLRNLTDQFVTLQVPNALVADMLPPAMGLTLPHVFSAPDFRALQILRDPEQPEGMMVTRRPAGPVPPIVLAPRAAVGMHADATQWYPSLKQPGEYHLQWRPYAGQLLSNELSIKVAAWKDAIIHTESGRLRVRLFYDQAPNTVENFLDLVNRNFYDGLTFHRILAGFIIQGGSPSGDDTGVRSDNLRLKAEFNNVRFERGTVAMARAPNDPDSASCQFFIALARLPQLDGKFTAFGQLVGNESFETLAKLEQVEVTDNSFGERSKPVNTMRIQDVTLENAPRPTAKPTRPEGQPRPSPGLAGR